jgi:hypothetical protein
MCCWLLALMLRRLDDWPPDDRVGAPGGPPGWPGVDARRSTNLELTATLVAAAPADSNTLPANARRDAGAARSRGPCLR